MRRHKNWHLRKIIMLIPTKIHYVQIKTSSRGDFSYHDILQLFHLEPCIEYSGKQNGWVNVCINIVVNKMYQMCLTIPSVLSPGTLLYPLQVNVPRILFFSYYKVYLQTQALWTLIPRSMSTPIYKNHTSLLLTFLVKLF